MAVTRGPCGEPAGIARTGLPAMIAPFPVYRVADLDSAVASLAERGWKPQPRFEIPHGPCCSLLLPGGHRVAVYEPTRPGATEHFAGRLDF